ncbi:single-stranded DNA-binding protein [Phycicoccus sp. BSK3Z-2]|uniref:Single-stranded DNA-binding protein n=1 Tax=Phycicoccus avicenniae TaxID=2828860 RepID=A0A941D7P5_9MICO|nr:single-stranded DNA-binding protein [Phycicoccus avicenniae]MBR7742335.1 single-stranded DNA-binding protein [Phycicoccus avicenniae]
MSGTDVNEVHLVGRVTAVGEVTELPSGDLVHSLRVTVRRVGRGNGRTVVDAVDVACWSAATRRVAGRLVVQDRVEVTGALRRRFFRTGGGAASRYEVEAHRIRRAPSTGGPSG